MLNAVKTMNPSQNKIPIVEFGEVEFEPTVLRSKTSLKPATRQLVGHPSDATEPDDFARERKILRAGSEGVSSSGPLVQSFRPRPQRSLKNGAKRPADESELQS